MVSTGVIDQNKIYYLKCLTRYLINTSGIGTVPPGKKIMKRDHHISLIWYIELCAYVNTLDY